MVAEEIVNARHHPSVDSRHLRRGKTYGGWCRKPQHKHMKKKPSEPRRINYHEDTYLDFEVTERKCPTIKVGEIIKYPCPICNHQQGIVRKVGETGRNGGSGIILYCKNCRFKTKSAKSWYEASDRWVFHHDRIAIIVTSKS